MEVKFVKAAKHLAKKREINTTTAEAMKHWATAKRSGEVAKGYTTLKAKATNEREEVAGIIEYPARQQRQYPWSEIN